ncbi:hypothetical protein R5W24_002206 [Gemmata sp. JC717]|uniref:hypothetical protein n=1 Tax=Gemmata algarum TaxID=2975278 RepID=UPI0021BB4429|nr:hypothetical protein [Gemmata algarum]MDY3553114.1 hypothetical protein [Gemmata algarum]
MQCFAHRGSVAVGLCKSCGKGVCSDCVNDTGVGLACRDDECGERVLLLDRIVANNARVMRTANSQTRSSGLLLLLMGLVLLGLGCWGYLSDSWLLMIMFGACGALFLLFGLLRLVVERYPSPER